MNKMGYSSIDEIRDRGLTPLNVRAFKAAWAEEEALVIDTRHQDLFAKGFIPGSIFIGIDDNFAMWVGALITDLQVPILFISEKGRENEVVTRLSRVGYDHSIGYLDGGFEVWKNSGEEVDQIEEIEANDFERLYTGAHLELNLLDIRKESEFDAQHIRGAINFPLDFINRNMQEIDPSKKYYLHCAGGYRSMIGASILRARGFEQLVNIRGGFNALTKTSLPMTEYHEQTTEL
jgi:rhodanese-related sulfurtransferase